MSAARVVDEAGVNCLRHRKHMRGFTLMEIMVVVIIIGIMISVATLSIGVLGRDSQSEEQARRIWAVLRQAREESELQGLDTGMFLCATGYEFMHFNTRRAQWLPIENDKLFAPRELPDGLRFRAWLESREIILKPDAIDRADANEDKKNPPQVMVLSSGEIMPFEVHIEREGGEALWRVVALADNDLRIEKRDFERNVPGPWQIIAQTRPAEEDERVASARAN
jgi:general secretion pathway protein H